MNEDKSIDATDIPIALYLNQRLTFDALAALEGGFSQFSTVQTTTSGTSSVEGSGEVGIGLSNIFALLGVKFGARGSQQEEQAESESSTQEIVHTPASLFARFRSELKNHGILQNISGASDLNDIRPGDIVEFETTLRRSAVVESLTAFVQLYPLMEAANEQTNAKSRSKRNQGKSRSPGPQSQDSMFKQVNSLLSAVTAEGSQDLVGEVSGISVVLTTEEKYFTDPTMNDIIDGTFRILGKVTRVIPNVGEEKISLLRKSPLGKFEALVPAIGESLKELGDIGSNDGFSTAIQGPAIQVIPIAIFS